MLDSNRHCCSKAKTTMEPLIESESDYEKKVDIYDVSTIDSPYNEICLLSRQPWHNDFSLMDSADID